MGGRALEPAALEAIRAAVTAQHTGSASETLALHQAETWRDRLISSDNSLAEWLAARPETDAQQLRSLVRQARKDAAAQGAAGTAAGAAPRHGRAYRDIFQLVREALQHESV